MKKLLNLVKLTPFKTSLIITSLMTLLYISGNIAPNELAYLKLMDKKWVDFIQRERGTIEHSDDIVVVAIDSKSIDAYGRWPWPRKRFAQLVEELNSHYQAKTIGFDIVFSEADSTSVDLATQYRKSFLENAYEGTPKNDWFLNYLKNTERDMDGDQQFADVVSKYDNVIFGYVFFGEAGSAHISPEMVDVGAERLEGSSISIVRGYEYLKDRRIPLPEGDYPELSIEKIIPRRDRFGSFNVSYDREDGVIRRVHSILKFRDRLYPALALKMLSHYWGAPISLSADEQGLVHIQLGKRFLYPNPDGSFLINYKGPAKTFKHYSISDIIQHKVPLEAIKDKIVLVGVTEVGILDIRITPVSETYPGVEVHANLLDNMITDTYFKQNWDNEVYSLLLILFVGIFLGIIIPRVNMLTALGITLGLILGYTVFHQYAVNEWLSWPSYVYVVVTMALCSVSVLQFMFFITDRDKRFIKGAFQQYLSPDVINNLLEDPNMLKLGGEEKVMTALFSDVKGFSSISEQLTPTELVTLLNEYLSEMSDIIMKYGGTVDKFEGDAIIAFFGAPVSYKDHAARAALTCIEMQNRLAEMRQDWKAEGRFELFQRVGINTGPMVVGNMGSHNRFNYTMMGNSVNLAARLEGVNKVYKIELLMSEMTFKACDDAVEGREVDLIRVVGINTPVRIYEIVCRKGELDQQREQAFPIFQEGLELYRQQEFTKAQKLFEKVLTILPNDGPSEIFIERCQQFLESPPPEEWDGVYSATSK